MFRGDMSSLQVHAKIQIEQSMHNYWFRHFQLLRHDFVERTYLYNSPLFFHRVLIRGNLISEPPIQVEANALSDLVLLKNL